MKKLHPFKHLCLCDGNVTCCFKFFFFFCPILEVFVLIKDEVAGHFSATSFLRKEKKLSVT